MDIESDSALAGKKKKPVTPRAKKTDTDTKATTSPAVNGTKKSPTKAKISDTTKKSPKTPAIVPSDSSSDSEEEISKTTKPVQKQKLLSLKMKEESSDSSSSEDDIDLKLFSKLKPIPNIVKKPLTKPSPQKKPPPPQQTADSSSSDSSESEMDVSTVHDKPKIPTKIAAVTKTADSSSDSDSDSSSSDEEIVKKPPIKQVYFYSIKLYITDRYTVFLQLYGA